MRTTTLLTVFCTAVLISCEPVSEPELNVPDPSFSKIPVVARVFGTGNTVREVPAPSPGGFRTFSFNAKQYADGTVDGQFEYNNNFIDVNGEEALVRGIGSVTCMTIVGNTVWLGGYFTQHSVPGTVGTPARFRVMDNGEGTNADPDSISYIWPGGVSPQPFCDNTPVWAWFVEVESGNIVVKG